jgi:hypothetical protein
MTRKQSEESFSEQEAVRRLEAALRGAKIAGHKPMSEVVKKRPAPRKKVRAAHK